MVLSKVLSFGEGKELRRCQAMVPEINAFEPAMQARSDAELRQLTDIFRKRLADGQPLDELLPEAFAAVREASVRTLGKRHFDVQLVGGGLILAGRLYHGFSGNAGHVGHVVVELDGPPCACGGRGCLEAIASGPNTVRHALDDGWRPRPGVVADGVALAAAAAAGDEIALRNVARAGRAVGTAIASCASLLDLEVAAIVGGFSQSGPSFWEPLHQAFTTHAGFPFAAACRVVPGQLGEAAGLLGAAAFVLDPDRYGWDPDPATGH